MQFSEFIPQTEYMGFNEQIFTFTKIFIGEETTTLKEAFASHYPQTKITFRIKSSKRVHPRSNLHFGRNLQ